jgi:hypothetical protein
MAVGLLIACGNSTPWNGSGDSGAPVFTNPNASSGGSGAPSGSSSAASSSGGDSGPDDSGGGVGEASSSGSTVMIMDDGGPCTACMADNDCRTACPAVQKLMPGYSWCCVTNYCIMWQGTCPMPATSGSSSGGGPCGAAMQPCCSMDPACQMGLSCQNDGTCG